MKITIPVLVMMFLCLWASDSSAFLFGEETPLLHRIIYVVIGLMAVIGIVAIMNNRLLTWILGRLGDTSGDERGPRPGDGAVIHHSSGEADFDGSPERVPQAPKDPKRDLPYPPEKSAD